MRAVLFDFGHTLFETVDEVERCRTYGVADRDDDIRAIAATVRAKSKTAEEIAKQRDLDPVRHRACWLDLLSPFDELAPGLAAHLYEQETSAAGWRPYPDTRGVLEALASQGVAMGVVSDVAFDLRPVFAAYDLDHYINAWTFSYRVGVAKPAPEMFLDALRQLDVDPRQALMVGDNELTDGGADQAGLSVLVLPATPPGAPRGLDVVFGAIG